MIRDYPPKSDVKETFTLFHLSETIITQASNLVKYDLLICK